MTLKVIRLGEYDKMGCEEQYCHGLNKYPNKLMSKETVAQTLYWPPTLRAIYPIQGSGAYWVPHQFRG